MPKKPSTILVMKNYPPLSCRRWYRVVVQRVSLEGRAAVCFDLSITDAPEQAGRRVVHRVSAVLAPNSPLCRFLDDGFGIRLAQDESLDLATLTGRVLSVRFRKPGDNGHQDIAAVRRIDEVDGHSSRPAVGAEGQEVENGLG